MIKNPFAKFDFSNPFGTRRTRNLFGSHTTPRDFKHGARDIPFGMGAASLYVDGTDGHDSNDGESWKTAKATIQEAVDTADSWTQIFVKAGTYAESVSISKDNLQLIAAKQWVVIDPAGTGIPVTISAHQTVLRNIHALGATAINHGAFEITGNLNELINCKYTNGDSHQGIRLSGNENYFYKLSNVADIATLVHLLGDENRFENCKFTGGATDTDNGFAIQSGSNKNRIYDCSFENFSKAGAFAIKLFSGSNYNTVYHNNFITNDTHISNLSTGLACFENFYDDHSNVDNGFGIAKAPYTFTTGTDPRPVVMRNGWLGLSWADADQVGDIKSRNVSMMEFWSDMDISVGLTTATANMPLPDVVVAGIPAGATITRVIGMIHPREFINTSGSGSNAINGAVAINVKKSAGAWGTDDVALINIPDNSWSVPASTRRSARMFVGDNDASSEVDENATYNLRFNGNVFVDYFTLGLVDVATGLQVYFTP